MSKQKVFALVPLIITAGLLSYTWSIIIFTEIEATWKHYIALLLFLILPYLQFRNFKWGLFATGIYFILGTCNLFSLTPSNLTNSYYIRLGSLDLSTPSFQPLSFGLLMLYLIVNLKTFFMIYLDYKFRDRETQEDL